MRRWWQRVVEEVNCALQYGVDEVSCLRLIVIGVRNEASSQNSVGQPTENNSAQNSLTSTCAKLRDRSSPSSTHLSQPNKATHSVNQYSSRHAPNSGRQGSPGSCGTSSRTESHLNKTTDFQYLSSIISSYTINLSSSYKMLFRTSWSSKRRSTRKDIGPLEKL